MPQKSTNGLIPTPMVNTSPPQLAISSNGNHIGSVDADGSVVSEGDLEPPICGSRQPIARRQYSHGQSKRARGGVRSWGWLAITIVLASLISLGSAAYIDTTSLDSRAPFEPQTPAFIERSAFSSSLDKRQDASPTSSCASPSATKEGRSSTFAVEAAMIPILVLLSGAFAGLTLGYMSLDATQLSVLTKSGTEKQKKLATKIMPLRKDGHLLLMTLIISNMCVKSTLRRAWHCSSLRLWLSTGSATKSYQSSRTRY